MLTNLLASIAGERVFIACRIEPIADKPGKTNKIPVDPRTGLHSDAQDPKTWLTLAEALATGYQVGIVLHERLGLFCIDVDAAYNGTEWSPLAQSLCQRFPGAYIEVSASGTGLHIFGRHRGIPDHRVKRKGLPLEVYTRARFILITGTSATGNIQSDHTEQLQAVIADYLPEPVVQRTDEWTTGPIPGWRGGGTDEQIVQMLRNRAGPHAIFGTGATFADLYDCNEEALARAFPSSNGKAWDGSGVDQALANHIAWGTGYDCDRTLRIMLTSKLVRDKWNREDYLHRTIRNAVAGKIPVTCEEREEPELIAPAAPSVASVWPPPPPPEQWPPPPPVQQTDVYTETVQPAIAMPTGVGRFLTAANQEELFAGCVYIEDIHGILMPDGSVLSQKQFDVRFGGDEFQMKVDGTKQTDSAWDAFTSSQLVKFPRAHGLTFDPKAEPRAVIYRDNFVYINSWVPVPIVKTEGDITPFLAHLYKLFPHGRDAEILLAYFAFLVQYPGVKAQWWPMLQGVEGNGKTFFSLALEYCVGQKYTHHAKASQLDNRFNSALYGKLLICVEDVHITEAKSSMWETLKPMITNTRLEIEGKGLDKVTRDVCFNGIMNSNHKDGVRKTRNDRRVAPFFGAQQYEADLIRDGLTKQYFQDLYNWARSGGFAAIAHFLTHYPIPDELNPAVGAIRAPQTSSTEQAVNLGRGGVEQEVQEAVESGKEGFRGGWISSIAFDRLLQETGKARYLPRAKRGELLEGMGYRPHPKLPNGRVIRALPDGGKPTLYVLAGHPSENTALHMFDVPKLFVDAQKPE